MTELNRWTESFTEQAELLWFESLLETRLSKTRVEGQRWIRTKTKLHWSSSRIWLTTFKSDWRPRNKRHPGRWWGSGEGDRTTNLLSRMCLSSLSLSVSRRGRSFWWPRPLAPQPTFSGHVTQLIHDSVWMRRVAAAAWGRAPPTSWSSVESQWSSPLLPAGYVHTHSCTLGGATHPAGMSLSSRTEEETPVWANRCNSVALRDYLYFITIYNRYGTPSNIYHLIFKHCRICHKVTQNVVCIKE